MTGTSRLSTAAWTPRPACCNGTWWTARWPRAFNHITAADITTDGPPERLALATASDFEEAAELVQRFYDELVKNLAKAQRATA